MLALWGCADRARMQHDVRAHMNASAYWHAEFGRVVTLDCGRAEGRFRGARVWSCRVYHARRTETDVSAARVGGRIVVCAETRALRCPGLPFL